MTDKDKFTHTPGPWTVEEIGQDDIYGHVYISGHITSPLHTYCGNTSARTDSIAAPDSMTRADAYLIAAAPDLLAALQLVAAQLPTIDKIACEAVRAAIAKATNAQPEDRR